MNLRDYYTTREIQNWIDRNRLEIHAAVEDLDSYSKFGSGNRAVQMDREVVERLVEKKVHILNHLNHVQRVLTGYLEEEPSGIGVNQVGVSPTVIEKPPMWGLRGFSRLFFPKQIAEKVFEQLIEDTEEEYFEALSKGEKWRARRIKWGGKLVFFLTVLRQIKSSAIGVLWKAGKWLFS